MEAITLTDTATYEPRMFVSFDDDQLDALDTSLAMAQRLLQTHPEDCCPEERDMAVYFQHLRHELHRVRLELASVKKRNRKEVMQSAGTDTLQRGERQDRSRG